MGLSMYDGCRPSSHFFSCAPASQSPSQMNGSRIQDIDATDATTGGGGGSFGISTGTGNGSVVGSCGSNSSGTSSTSGMGFGVFLTKNYRSHKSIFEVNHCCHCHCRCHCCHCRINEIKID